MEFNVKTRDGEIPIKMALPIQTSYKLLLSQSLVKKNALNYGGDHSNIGDDNLCAGGKDKGPCNVRYQ